MNQTATAVRFGILGAARIAPAALVHPAWVIPNCEVVAIAARDHGRAQAFAHQHNIPITSPTYEALLADPCINAVYVPLVASLHREWCERAILAGMHVLCEKPLATNVADAQHLVALAEDRGVILAEAFHYRYHPLCTRVLEITRSGELGKIDRVEAVFANAVPPDLPRSASVYWDARLGGGATLHNGCYTAHILRTVMRSTPAVTRATTESWEEDESADAALEADLTFHDGTKGRLGASFIAHNREISLRLTTSAGELYADNFVLPHIDDSESGLNRGSVVITTSEGSRREVFPMIPTYVYQLDAFVESVRTGALLPTTGVDIIENARLLEELLSAAGSDHI